MDEHVTYMNSGSALSTWDLLAPDRSLWVAMGEPRPCRVCGKERPGMLPLRSHLDRDADPHAACDRQIRGWEHEIVLVDADPDYRAALAVLETAQAEADRIWEAKVRALGLPDWIVEQAIDRHTDWQD